MGTIWVSSFFARTGIEEGDLGAAKVKRNAGGDLTTSSTV